MPFEIKNKHFIIDIPAKILEDVFDKAVLSILCCLNFSSLPTSIPRHCENSESLPLYISKCFLRVIAPLVDKHWEIFNTLPILLGRAFTHVPFSSNTFWPAQMSS